MVDFWKGRVGMADFWEGLGIAVLRPPRVWDNTSGRCFAETGTGAFGLLIVIEVAFVLTEPLLATSVDRFHGNGREKKP